MIAILSHHVKSGDNIYQPLIDNLEINLKDKGADYFLLAHSLEGDFKPFLKENGQTQILDFNAKGVKRYFAEINLSLKILKDKKPEKIIGLNPLNAIAGLVYKKLYDKNVKVCYYIPDFSPKRFENPVLNNVYHFIETYCTKNADEVWAVSKKVYEMKQKDNKNIKLYYNYPPQKLVKECNQKDREGLVLAGLIDDYYILDEVFEAAFLLKEKITLIGGGKKIDEVKQVLRDGLKKSVYFAGFVEKKDFFKEFGKYKVSVALYDNSCDYNNYRDSVKCRDSIAVNIPIITSNNHSLAQDIERYNLGIVLDSQYVTKENIAKAYQTIILKYDFYITNLNKYYLNTNKNDQILTGFINS